MEQEKKHEHEHEHHVVHHKKKKKQYAIIALAVILLLAIIGGAAYYKMVYLKTHLSPEAAKAKITDFINTNLVQPGTKAEVTSITKENGLYKVEVNLSGQKITSYMTMDGKNFFPNVMNIDDIANKANANGENSPSKPSAEVPKTDTPQVDLFVMSYCPFGTQIEKGILPVVKALGTKIKFNLRFVSYAMHDKKELDENLREYCIQKNEPTKLDDYLTCFLKDSTQSDACVKSTGINATRLASCIAQTDEQYKVTASYNDKSTWNNGTFPPFNVDKADNDKYGVQGSPTLVINGVQANAAGRDSASLLKTICSAFKTAPKECEIKLSSDVPASGFGEGTAPATSNSAPAGGCGN